MNTESFALRHIGIKEDDHTKIFKTIGVESLDQLIKDTIPDDILLKEPLNLPKALSLIHI